MSHLLRVDSLSVAIGPKSIVNSCSFTIEPSSLHIIMGPNGSGKSSCAYALSGSPKYTVSGTILMNGRDISELPAHERARAGLFVAFQQPPEIPGVQVDTFLMQAYQLLTGQSITPRAFHELLDLYMPMVGLELDMRFRGLNEGFSGGQKKKLELLQMLLFAPQMIIADEIDSGLDVDAITQLVNVFAHIRADRPNTGMLVITHNTEFARRLAPDHVHIMHDGNIVHRGTIELIDMVAQRGYDGSPYYVKTS